MPGKMHKSKTIKFVNCYLVRNGCIIRDDLWVRDGVIVNPEPIFYEEKELEDFRVDCHNLIIAPGFIDLQINGGYGFDFSSDELSIEKAVSTVRSKILSAGVTSFCPTVVTSPIDVYRRVLPQIKRERGGKHGAEVLGIHLEGPFISPEKKGAHPLPHISILENGFESVTTIYGSLDNVSIITLAPELAESSDVIRELTQDGRVVVSLGHSTGSIQDGETAVNAGASFITHLFNAMLPFHHRDPGLVGLLTSQYIEKPVFYGIIADGIHTHPAALRIAHKTHSEGLVLVTDAMAALGLGDGAHKIGQLTVEVSGRRAYLSRNKETLAGSIAPMDECLRGFIKSIGGTIVDGIEAASLHPAQVLNLKHKGRLDFGCDADFVLLKVSPNLWGRVERYDGRGYVEINKEQIDQSCKGISSKETMSVEVLHTLIGGECVYSKEGTEDLVYRKTER